MYKAKAISLKPHNSFGIEVMAKEVVYLFEYGDVKHVFEQIDSVKNFIILGGGSNVLFTQDFFDGTVFINKITGIKKVEEDNDKVCFQVMSGENWHDFVKYCVENNLSGVENLALIPGTVGAAPIQNIGAYGVELSAVCKEVSFYNYEQKRFDYLNNHECKFGYRDSIFKKELKNKVFITSVTIELQKKFVANKSYTALQDYFTKHNISNVTLQDVFNAVVNIRQSKLPDYNTIGNAGSFFKNPVIHIKQKNALQEQYPNIPYFTVDDEFCKIPAAWLIEQCGWKGFRENDYGCYEKQPLVLVNFGNATGQEINNLSERIKKSVLEKFNIELQKEVNII